MEAAKQDDPSSQSPPEVYEDSYVILEELSKSEQKQHAYQNYDEEAELKAEEEWKPLYETVAEPDTVKKAESGAVIVTETGLSMTFDEIAAYLAKDETRPASQAMNTIQEIVHKIEDDIQDKATENLPEGEGWPYDDRNLPALKDSIWNQRFQEIMALPETEDKYHQLAYLAHDKSPYLHFNL